MTLKHILSFLASLIITLIVFAAVVFAVGYSDFLITSTLAEKQKQYAIFFCLQLLILTGSFYLIIRFFKRNRKFTAIGMCLPVLAGLFILIILGKSYTDLTLTEPFNKSKWTEANYKPFKMAKSLTKSNMLIGKSRQEVIEMLGISHDVYGEPGTPHYISYTTDNGSWILVLDLENDKVTDSFLWEDNICI